jgi:hypothetical protein
MATSPLFEELERVMRAPMVADNLPCSAQCVLSGSQMRTHRTNSVDRARISIDIMGVDDVLMHDAVASGLAAVATQPAG